MTIEDTLHPHEMIPADRPGADASPTPIPRRPKPGREVPVAFPE